jgi:hypothetical protein
MDISKSRSQQYWVEEMPSCSFRSRRKKLKGLSGSIKRYSVGGLKNGKVQWTTG